MSHDTWIHRCVRVVVRPLARTAITPNHVTTLRLATGLAAAGCLAVGPGPWTWAGAALFVVSMLCDRADGELARLTGRTSPAGHMYDLATDAVSDAVILLGLGVGLRAGPLGGWAIAAGCVAASSVAAIFAVVIDTEHRHGHGTVTFEAVWGVDPDDAMLVIPVVAALGLGEPLVIAAAICAPIAAVLVVTGILRRRRVAGGPRRSAAGAQAQQVRERPQQVDGRADAGEDEEGRQ